MLASIQKNRNKNDNFRLLHDHELPIYTVLLPLYKEGKVLKSLVRSISAIDYPKDKLQALLLIEEDDIETINAIKTIKIPNYITAIYIPHSYPKTKPKACNIGLSYAKGELVCIFDADDRPHPMQLRKVASFLRNQPENCVCVQCHLNFYNAAESWISNMFEIEYRLLFDYTLPFAAFNKWPFPLGGSSNHFKSSFIHKFNWDSYNVTEDAELGMRLACYGFYATTLNIETKEEAPYTLGPWLKQRSRWIKGYLITSMIYLRHYKKIIKNSNKQIGKLMFFHYIMFCGPLLMLFTPVALLISAVFVYNPHLISSNFIKDCFLFASYANFFIFYLTFATTARITFAKNTNGLLLYLTYPLYFLLHIVGASIAIYKVITNPYYWEKTEHGVSKINMKFFKKTK